MTYNPTAIADFFDSLGAGEWVIAKGGMQITSVVFPESSAVLDASGERVLLLERDELEVETVVVRQVDGLGDISQADGRARRPG